jgi:hypothetical protein
MTTSAPSDQSSHQTAAAAPKAGDGEKATQPHTHEGTITCPLTGEKIPSCCCPLEK